MHTAPPFQMTVQRFAYSRAALSALALTVTVVVSVWGWPVYRAVPSWWPIAVVVLVYALAAGVLRMALSIRPVRLRWDTQHWYLVATEAEAQAGVDPLPGDLTVCVDLGVWMLLRIAPPTAPVLHSGTWLPVQRTGHEPDWHLLRSTVYCARPVSQPDGAPF